MEEGNGPAIAELVAQVVEGCPLLELVALIAKNNEASEPLIAVAHRIATVPASRGALLAAGLPATLIALIASEAPPSQRPALNHPATPRALALLREILRGPEAAGTAGVVIAAGGVAALAATMPAGGAGGANAAECLLEITKLDAHGASAVAAGAVPALLEAVKGGAEHENGRAAAAARTLLLLRGTRASVEAEVLAAGLDVAALERLAGHSLAREA